MNGYGGDDAAAPPTPGRRSGGAEDATDQGGDVELVMVTMAFDASDVASLVAVLSKYVVLTRMEAGCRNVDMVKSETKPDRILIVEKWESPDHQRAHFDGETMVDMAKSCRGIISAPPDIDMWQSMSAHDLR